MFTRREQLDRKGGPEERLDFLGKLKHEYLTTTALEAKRQVLANLANFAYDPINFPFIKQLRIVDLFIDALHVQAAASSAGAHVPNDEVLCGYAVGGLCNLANDPEIAQYIIAAGGVHHLADRLHLRNADNIETVLNALTALYYLAQTSPAPIVQPAIVDRVERLRAGASAADPRLVNLTAVFLRDLCGRQD